MEYQEFIYIVLLLLTLGSILMPASHLSWVVCALLLAAIRRENTWSA